MKTFMKNVKIDQYGSKRQNYRLVEILAPGV